MTAAVGALASTALRRVARDRIALFFLIVLPVLIILVIGVAIGGFDAFRFGVVDQGAGPAGRELAAALSASDAIDTERFDDVDAARTALRRVELDAVVVLRDGLDDVLASGGDVEVPVLGERTNATHNAARQAVAGVLAEASARVQAARFHQAVTGGTLDESAVAVDDLASSVPPIRATRVVVDAESGELPEGFGSSAPTMLVLFVFLSALAGGAALIQSRRLGVHDRILAGPVAAGTIVAGEALSYLLIALLQSAIIVGVGAGLFGVRWGDPLAAAMLVACWAAVGTGAGMLAGTVFRTEEQASSIGVTVGMVAGMLGGTMWPLAIVPDAIRVVGHAVPHAWAVDAWTELLSHDAGLADIAPNLGVLAAFAVGLVALASLRLRRLLTG